MSLRKSTCRYAVYDQFIHCHLYVLSLTIGENGAAEHEKKCNRGNGTKLTPIFLISLFNSPLNLNDAVVPLIAMDMIQLRCSYRGSLRECARITANGSATTE
eukprot:793272_1